MGLGTKAARGALSTMFWQSNRVLVQLGSVVILSRLVAPHDVGLLAMVVALTGFGELLRDFGLSMAAVQAKSLSPGQKSNLFWINSGIGLLLTLAVYSLAHPIAWLYGEPALVEITRWISLTFLLNGLATQFRAELNRRMRFTVLSLSELVPQALGLAAGILVALQTGSYAALIAQQLAVAACGLAFVVLAARWWPGRPDRQAVVMPLLRFGAGLAGTQSVSYLAKNADNVAIGYVWGPAVLGIYGRAYQLVMMPLGQFTAPLSRVAIPVLTRLADDPAAFLRYLRAGQAAAAFFTCTAYGLIFGLADPFVRVALGEPWLGMVPIVQALSVGAVFRALGQGGYWIFVAKGLTGQQFRFYLATQPVIVAAMLAGLPWGGLGVAIGYSAAYALFWLAQMHWAGRVAAIDTGSLLRNGATIVLVVALPVAAIALAATELVASPWLQMPAAVAAVAPYLAAVLLLPPSARRETRRLMQLVRGRTVAGEAA
ncbi:lipopolysaccharide biosynthesis protein [Geminicoccus roseus]|uniref:lipopolysaccharide biosynthesis protein n=1 Tax=Geminicoccus roseus TaxID=404900 RepID=UPI0003FB67DB|nr:lipopolysaccharide biosynthesis protein [Geminicoccus roseus]